jgi:hypothetical protein
MKTLEKPLFLRESSKLLKRYTVNTEEVWFRTPHGERFG